MTLLVSWFLQILSFLSDIPTVHLIVVWYTSHAFILIAFLSCCLSSFPFFFFFFTSIFCCYLSGTGCRRDRWSNTITSIINRGPGYIIFKVAKSGKFILFDVMNMLLGIINTIFCKMVLYWLKLVQFFSICFLLGPQ